MNEQKNTLSAALNTAAESLVSAIEKESSAKKTVADAEIAYRKAEKTFMTGHEEFQAGFKGGNESSRKALLAVSLADEKAAEDAAKAAKLDAETQKEIAYIGWTLAREQVKIASIPE